jgi:hypothetical protein
LFLLSGHALFESVALPVQGQDVSMMGKAIQLGSRKLFTAEDLWPLGENPDWWSGDGLRLIAVVFHTKLTDFF